MFILMDAKRGCVVLCPGSRRVKEMLNRAGFARGMVPDRPAAAKCTGGLRTCWWRGMVFLRSDWEAREKLLIGLPTGSRGCRAIWEVGWMLFRSEGGCGYEQICEFGR